MDLAEAVSYFLDLTAVMSDFSDLVDTSWNNSDPLAAELEFLGVRGEDGDGFGDVLP